MHRHPPTTYVSFVILDMLTAVAFENDVIRQEHIALKKIWQYFNEERIRFITCSEEMEQDIIIGLNSLGCCVTDTVQITDNIEEFERWDRVDREETKRWRQIIDLYDQLEVIGDYEYYYENVGKRKDAPCADKGLLMPIHDDALKREGQENCYTRYSDEDVAILRDCVNDLGNWYTKDVWRDLRRVEYNLNWRILEKILREHSLEPVLHGDKACRNKYLFGLLNRVVGFCKKSCSRFPLDQDHILFIIHTVMKKYHHREDRGSVHIIKCIEHGIDYFLCVDDVFIDRFNERRHLLLLNPDCRNCELELIRPVELESRLR